MPGTIAVLTMTRGRHAQLLGQVDGLSVGSLPPHLHSVVSMGDRDLTRGRLPLATDRWQTVVKPVPTDRRALPLAAARNVAAHEAMGAGAQLLVFLDGDVIPGSRTLERYADAIVAHRDGTGQVDLAGPVLWCGPVQQLPEPQNDAVGYPFGRLDTLARRTPGTPQLRIGEVRAEPRWELFRALAFVMTAEDFRSTGGFHPGYTGHGLEDADFAEVVRRAGGSMAWVGGATSYLQPGEPVAPEQEVKIAVQHARVWRERWGQPSRHPWLTRLVGEGRLRQGPDGSYRAV
ncbi:glycosyltransferase family 2 protein [Ornithinimicrobium sp. Y1694]|uniref:glycosyltransferase family 2 protein n=1 Tax=Ornithinimicrobium sp. Y1694 TaxID=3418590 RepID=UPI003CE94DBB